MMGELVDLLYGKTVGVTFLIGLIVIVRPFILEKMNAKLAYQIWFIVPVYLLLPSLNNELQSNMASWTFYLEQELLLPKVPAITNNISQSISETLLLVWSIGFFIAFSIYLVKYRTLSRSLRKSNFKPADILIKEYLTKAGKQFDFVESDLVTSPAVFGMVRAKIILPKNFLQQKQSQREVILNHELFHIRRRDHQINQFRNFIKCLFWFNPVVQLADRYFEADQELSCDLGVLQNNQYITPKQYATALLSEAIADSRTALLSQWNYSQLIKKRINMIGKQKNKLWHKLVALAFGLSSLSYASMIVANEMVMENSASPVDIVNPKYPKAAAQNGVEGSVTFEFNLSDEGKVQNLQIVRSEPEGIFDEAAETSIRQWTFTKNQHIKGRKRYTMEFKLGPAGKKQS